MQCLDQQSLAMNTNDMSQVEQISKLQIALQTAVEDIAILQGHLSFLIKLKDSLVSQIEARTQREEALKSQYKQKLSLQEEKISELQESNMEMAELLKQTQKALNQRESALQMAEKHIERKERIINEQHSTMQDLEEEVLAAKHSAEISCQSIFPVDTELSKKLQIQLQKAKAEEQKAVGQWKKQTMQRKKFQKEVEEFKKWLGGLCGMKRVVEGCQSVLMEEVASRLAQSRQ